MKLILGFALFLTCLNCRGGIPASYDDIVKLYGPPDRAGSAAYFSGEVVGTNFTSDDISIKINSGADHNGILFMIFTRTDSFSPMEIADLLKPLSTEEAWVQKDSKDWVLPKAGAKAHWDGEGKLTVKAS